MPSKTDILALVFDCLDDLNKQLPPAERVIKSHDSMLVGTDGSLDLLSIITLLAAVEDAMCRKYGLTISLIDDPELAGEANHFRTLGSLASYIAEGNS